MTPESMALLIHVGERSVFVVAGLFCLWLNYRLLGATSEFSKWSEQATSNVQSAIAILKLAITEAKQTLERISAAEKNARRERTDFTETIEQIAGTKLEKIYQDIGSATTKARYEEDSMKRESESLEKWKENLTTMLGEISTKIDKMEESRLATLLKILDRRLKLGRFSSAALAVIGTLLLIFAALGAFHA